MELSAVAASVGRMAILLPELLVSDPAALRAWLEEHHAMSPGVRLVLTKKGGTDTSITWASALPVRYAAAIADACVPTARRTETASDHLYGRRKPSSRKKVVR